MASIYFYGQRLALAGLVTRGNAGLHRESSSSGKLLSVIGVLYNAIHACRIAPSELTFLLPVIRGWAQSTRDLDQ